MSGTTINPFRFGGQAGYYRDGANRAYVRARHLDSAKGRWISRDPVGLKGGDINLYRYCRNSPITHTDPTGNQNQITVLPQDCEHFPHLRGCDAKERAISTAFCAVQHKQALAGCFVYADDGRGGISLCIRCNNVPSDKYCCIGQCKSRGKCPPCGNLWYSYACASNEKSARDEACKAACLLANQGNQCHPGHCREETLKCFKKGKPIK